MISIGVIACVALPSMLGPRVGEVQLGGFLAELTDLDEPTGAAIAPDGRMLVAESFRDHVVVLDAERRRVSAIGSRGHGEGGLSDPRGLALAPDGELYVADAGNHRVVVFRLDGAFVRAFGVRGSGPSEFRSPRGVAVDRARCYVADTKNHRVQVFERSGRWIRAFGAFGSRPGELRHPAAVAADATGRLFVADTDNHRVQKFDAQGRFLAQWGVFGPFTGQLAFPTGIVVHGERVYVADRDNHRIEVFDLEGRNVHGFGIHALRPHEGAGKLHYPNALAIAPDGTRMLVVEGFENRGQLFGPIGASEVLATAGQERNTAAHYGGAVDAGGDLMVAVEPGAPGIVVFDTTRAEPVEITRHGGYGLRRAEFVRPEAVELDPAACHAYVADPGALRIADYRVDRKAGEELGYDPALARLAQSLDLAALARLEPDGGWSVPIEPVALECAADGTLFALDAAAAQVVELSPGLEVRRRFGKHGLGPRELLGPVDLAVDAQGTEIFVVDELAARVVVFARAGEFLRSLGRRGEGAGEFSRPSGIACAPDGSVWVADQALHRIQQFEAQGRVLRAFGREGLGRVEFYKPRGLAFDRLGQLVVIDYGNHRGQTLTAEGGFVNGFGARLFTQATRAPVRSQGEVKQD